MSQVIHDEQARKRLAKNLGSAMELKAMTQAELARATGESEMRISLYRRGVSLPSIAVASRIAEALSITVDDLLK